MDPAAPDSGVASTTRRTVGSGVSITTFFQVGSVVAGGLTTVVVARLLGPAGTGAFSVVLSTTAGAALIATLGLDSGALFYVSGRRWNAANAIRQLQVAALVLGLAGAGLGLAAWFVLRRSAFDGVGVATVAFGLAGLPFALSWLFGSYVALARDHYERAALAPLVQGGVGLGLVSVLTPLFGVTGAVLALTLSQAVAAVWTVARGLRETAGQAEAWLAHAWFELALATRFGLKANTARVMSLINQRADILILNAYASQATVGHYGVALSLTALQLLLPSSLSRVVVPRVSSLDEQDAEAERLLVISKSVKHGVLVSTVGAVAMAFVLLAVPIVFGRDFEPAVRLGWILVPGTAAFGFASVLAATIIGKGHPGSILRSAVIVTPITVALYVLLIPMFKATGAAVASTISYSLTLALYWFFFRRLSAIRGMGPILPGRDEVVDYIALIRRLRERLRAAR